jgi:ferredoxin
MVSGEFPRVDNQLTIRGDRREPIFRHEADEDAGVEMEAGCFNCSCGTCAVEIVSGMENLEEPTPEELDVLDQWNKDPEKYRLTCCVRSKQGEVVIRGGH